MDLIAAAQAKRTLLMEQIAKLDIFLETARELGAEAPKMAPGVAAAVVRDSFPQVMKTAPSRPKTGVGADTLNAAEELVRELGPMSSRDMLPFILEKGIEVGGKDPVATLSARISNKGDLMTYSGKWHFKDELASLGLNGLGQKETADNPTKDTSAASLFSNQEGGESDAPALT